MATLSWVFTPGTCIGATSDAPAAPLVAARTLAAANLGDTYTVTSIETPGALGERLMELGFVQGTQVTVVRRGPFGGPIQVALRGAHLSLRRAQADDIWVTDAYSGCR